MKIRGILAAAAFVAALATGGGANAQLIAVDNICEPAGGQVNTVNVRLMSLGLFEYSFRRVSDGQVTVFAATTAAWNRKFALAPGSYKLSFKHPNSTPVGTWANTVLVRDYRLVGGTCVLVSPLDKARKVNPNAAGF